MKGRIRSTHLHDNNGKEDSHLFPFFAEGGTIDWKKTMELLRRGPEQYPAAAGAARSCPSCPSRSRSKW